MKKPRGGRGLARLKAELTGAGRDGTGPRQWLEPATVIAVALDAAADGYPLLTVEWRGVKVHAPYLAGYVPTVGDVVVVAYQEPKLLVLGTVVGLP